MDSDEEGADPYLGGLEDDDEDDYDAYFSGGFHAPGLEALVVGISAMMGQQRTRSGATGQARSRAPAPRPRAGGDGSDPGLSRLRWSDEKWRAFERILQSHRMQDEGWDLCAELNRGAVPPPSSREALVECFEALRRHLVASVPKVQRMAHVGSSAKLTDIGLDSDVDAIAYIERPRSGALPSQEEMDAVLVEIQASLQRLKVDTEVRDFYTGEGEAVLNSESKQTYVTGEYRGISFDILLGSEPQSEAELAELFSSSEVQRRTKFFLKTSLSERNTKWVREMPWQVRRAIRLLKWLIYAVCCWSSKGGGAPWGILLELITIDVWRQLGKPATCSVLQLFEASLLGIVHWRNFRVVWTRADPHTLPSQPRERWALPIVCDPHNPVRNVAFSMGGDDTTRKRRWTDLANYAQKTYDRRGFWA